jgi:hypothetical protein
LRGPQKHAVGKCGSQNGREIAVANQVGTSQRAVERQVRVSVIADGIDVVDLRQAGRTEVCPPVAPERGAMCAGGVATLFKSRSRIAG